MQIKNILTVHEQGSGPMNEDQLLVGETIFGVFDGATSLDKYKDDEGSTGGFLASLTAKEVFAKEDKNLVGLAKEANQIMAEKMNVAGINASDKGNLWTTSIAAIRISDRKFEWLTLSDSVIILVDKNGNHKLLGELHDHDVETIKLWEEYAKQGIENIREKLTNVILENRRRMNIEYGALDGEPEFINFIQHGEESLDNVAHLILTTDGLFMPTKNAGETDWDTFVKLYLEGGLEKVRDEVRQRQESDPKMWEYPRLKPFDDMGAIALQF